MRTATARSVPLRAVLAAALVTACAAAQAQAPKTRT
jgi:hypothetical protein